jgi:hypothetical protein
MNSVCFDIANRTSLFQQHESLSSIDPIIGSAGMEEDSHRSKRQKNGPTSELCMHCKLLNLEESFNIASRFYQGVRDGSVTRKEAICKASNDTYFYDDAFLVHRFQDRLSRPSNCPMCSFFRSLRVQRGSHDRYKLLAFRSSDSWMFSQDTMHKNQGWEDMKDPVFMAVVPDVEFISPCGHEENWLDKDIPARGGIYLLEANESSAADAKILLRARELNDKVNLRLVREWLSICRANHGKVCERRNSHEPITQGFRLIDCSIDPPRVEDQPWGTKYAALSYVWGTSPGDKEDWPSTLLDAVAITKEMGLRYLWVDRRCINQSDEEEKAYLVSRMMTIYEEACFTIVAAAGSGANYGLPGVRSTPRKPQPKYNLDSGRRLVSTLRDPRRDILESDYWTRGWTYQEGILSNRRIVFTDDQVYWECRCMASHESINMPLFHMPSSDEANSESRMADFVLTGIFKGDAYSGGSLSDHDDLVILQDDAYRLDYGFPMYQEATTRAQLRGLNEHIRAFSKRNLTRDEDSLRAFLGIISMYKRNELLYLFQGIPMWTGRLPGGLGGAQVTFALSVCSWYHRSGPDFQMFVSQPCRRKSGFPSWTWAGWDGTVTWRAPPNNEHGAFMSDLIAARTLRLLWAADIYLGTLNEPQSIRLHDIDSANRLGDEALSLVVVKNPLILKYFRREPTEKSWQWVRMAGRTGRERCHAGSPEWDGQWYRIAGKLCCIGLSVSMTETEWTMKHFSGELISVLVFAGKYPSSKHGCALFLTLQRAGSATGRWERIGTLYLIIPYLSAMKRPTNTELLKRIPAHIQGGDIVIQ